MPKKVGIFPLAVTLIVLGVSIAATKLTGVDWFGKALNLWPLVLIAIGFEIVWWQTRSRNGQGPGWKLDGKSIFLLTLVLVISGIFHTVNSIATAYSKDGIWGIVRGFNGVGPSQTVALEDKDYPNLAAAESIYIENSVGKLQVEGTDDNQVHLRADATTNAVDRATAEERASHIHIRVNEGKEARVIVADDAGSGSNGFNRPAVNLVLQVPKKMIVSSKTNAGEVAMTGLAQVNVESDMGKVSVQKIAGSAKVRSHAGEIEVSEVGSSELQSDMGRVSVNEVKGSLRARTDAGQIGVHNSSPVAGDWDLQTDMGAIDIAYPENSSVRFEGKTDMGAIKGRDVRQNQKGPNSEVKFGDGKFLIRATTNAGKIDINN